MNTLLLILLIMTEAAFCYVTVSRGSDKGEYKLGRLIANGGELVLFLLTLLLPGIDLSFRFTMLITLLIIRAAAAAIMMLFRKKDRDEKKAFSKIMSAIGSALLFASALIPSYLFSGYNGLPVSGKYTVAQTKAIVIDKNRTEGYKDDGSKREVPSIIRRMRQRERAFPWYSSRTGRSGITRATPRPIWSLQATAIS